MKRNHFTSTFLVTVTLLAGCVGPNVATSGFTAISAQSGIMLMPPDIRYYTVTASGLSEPNAEWTEKARANFDTAFGQFTARNDMQLQKLREEELSDVALEYDKLHSAVGATILTNHFGIIKLPAKEGAFDWSLGPNVSNMMPGDNQRYGLFVHYRDYQASGGRVGVAVFAALMGASVYSGHQAGFASLVDLETGNVVWFNYLPSAQGDMRSAEGARRIVDQLFSTMVESQ